MWSCSNLYLHLVSAYNKKMAHHKPLYYRRLLTNNWSNCYDPSPWDPLSHNTAAATDISQLLFSSPLTKCQYIHIFLIFKQTPSTITVLTITFVKTTPWRLTHVYPSIRLYLTQISFHMALQCLGNLGCLMWIRFQNQFLNNWQDSIDGDQPVASPLLNIPPKKLIGSNVSK